MAVPAVNVAAVVPSCPRQQFSKYAGVAPSAGVVSLYAINSVPMVMKPAVGTFTNDVIGMVVAVAEVVLLVGTVEVVAVADVVLLFGIVEVELAVEFEFLLVTVVV